LHVPLHSTYNLRFSTRRSGVLILAR
jgi:hypothetical protein